MKSTISVHFDRDWGCDIRSGGGRSGRCVGGGGSVDAEIFKRFGAVVKRSLHYIGRERYCTSESQCRRPRFLVRLVRLVNFISSEMAVS